MKKKSCTKIENLCKTIWLRTFFSLFVHSLFINSIQPNMRTHKRYTKDEEGKKNAQRVNRNSGKSEMSPVDSVIRLCLLTYICLSSALEKLWSFFVVVVFLSIQFISVHFLSVFFFFFSIFISSSTCSALSEHMKCSVTKPLLRLNHFYFIVFFVFYSCAETHWRCFA